MQVLDPQNSDLARDVLPHYVHNPRGGSIRFAILLTLTSLVMAGITYFGVYAIPYWLCAIPFAVVVHRAYFFSLYRNAVHDAMRDAAMDARLDNIIAERYANSTLDMKSGNTLDAAFFQRKLVEEGNG